MALLVWLPLNGNLKNQGLSNVTVTNNGATINDNGKIGKCYNFATNLYLEITNLSFRLLSNCSLCFWLKYDNEEKWLPFSGQGEAYYILAEKSYTTNFYHNSIGSNTIKIYVDGILSTAPSNDGQWHHYCITGVDLTSWTKFYINRYTSTSNIFNLEGQYNDIRIYDHYLSPKEVKEISKGLVLHYKLDETLRSNTNLLPQSSRRMSETGLTSSTEYINLCSTTNIWETYGLVPYTLSFDIKAAVAHSFIIYGTYGSGYKYLPPQKTINVTTEWLHIVYTFTPYLSNESGTWSGISVYGTYGSGAIVSVRRIKLELGSVATSVFDDNGIIYDCSGYNNNSTFTGLSINKETSRYNSSTHFDGITGCIPIAYNSICPLNIFTSNLWFKKDTVGTKAYETLWGGPSGFEMDTRANTASTLSLYMASVRGGTLFSPFNFGEWYMITMTRDNTNEKYYINGELKKTIESKPMPTGNYFIGAWKTATQQNILGEISDFRLYATVLNANDILELYNTSAYVYNNQTLATYLFVEESVTPQSFKTGVFKSNTFLEGEISEDLENTTNVEIIDGEAWLKLLHHNNPAVNLFTSSNCWNYNGNNLFSNLDLLRSDNSLNSLSEYEFLAKEKLESSSTEVQIRWKQTNNPATTTTATGYTLISGNPAHLSPGLVLSGGTHGCIDINGSDWWCCCGCYTAYQGGIPGFMGVIKSGYLDLYIKINNSVILNKTQTAFYSNKVETNQLIEI